MPRSSLADIAQLGAAIALSAVAAHYLWKLFRGSNADSDRKKELAANALKASASKSSGPSPDDAETIWVYFGSQSGTAEGFCQELEQEAKSHDLNIVVEDLENFNEDDFVQHKTVVLIVATYGEGDPTDNAIDFFKWIQDESLSSDTLSGMRFAVMGLGNRQYVNFNSMGKIADKDLERLGAQRIHDRGEGDDDQNIEEDFEQWKDAGLWTALKAALGKDTNPQEATEVAALESAAEVQSKLQLRGVVVQDEAPPVDSLVQNGGADVLGKWYFQASTAPITVCRELRQEYDLSSGKTTKHLDVSIKHLPAFEWKTADNLEVLPRNPEETVDWVAQRLGVQAQLKSSLTFVRAAGVDKAVRKPFPCPCTVSTALDLYCDLGQAPSRGSAKRFGAFVADEKDRDFLGTLLQDREAYQWLTGEGVRLSLCEFFQLFMTSAEIDLSTFLQLCPRQKNRPYTIASSSREDSKTIGICVSMIQEDLLSLSAIVEGLASRGHTLPNAVERLKAAADQGVPGRCFRGSCSTMLCTRSAVGDKLMIFARASSFRLPKRTTTPIIMLGAGTGIAPFRGFLREFISEKGVRQKTILFFGCTKRDTDYVYRDELEESTKSQPPAFKELVTAFSREQSHKIYVQHKLKERAEDMKKLVEEGAYIYTCGSVGMGKSVRDEFAAILGSSDQVDRLSKEGRFVEELW
jgi:NADPH-ferrihemoprotein reductase